MTPDKINLANNAYATGRLERDFEFRNEFKGEKFFQSRIIVERTSGKFDTIPIIVSDTLLKDLNIKAGEKISVQGQFRSYRKKGIDGKRHLELFLYVINIKTNSENNDLDTNIIYLYGKVVNPTIFKKTKRGKKATELMILVPRKFYNNSDYMPCISWGSMAYYSRDLKVGDFVEISGRIQSRNYRKRIDDFSYEEKEAFEIAILKINKVE